MLIAIVEVHLQHHQVDFGQRFLALLQLMFFSGLPVVYIAQPTFLKYNQYQNHNSIFYTVLKMGYYLFKLIRSL